MQDTQSPSRGFSGTQVALILLAVVVVTVGLTLWVAWFWLFPREFRPVELNAREQAVLESKLQRLERVAAPAAGQGKESDAEWLRPVPYSEADADRRIELSERELNALIARDPALAHRLAVDLGEDLASARLLLPLPPDFPLLGGRTLRVNAGLEMRFADGRPQVRLRGVSVMGVPLPNAWLGNLKNVDLVAEFGRGPGFWRSFAAGIDNIRVADGQLLIELRE
ncbi:MAG: arginine N-succinyltransferase [Gammaproteobacteria bacterium]|nr:MAG: arginine N-succinyltransferase [Gammaproteobacteria bacterium]